MAPLPPSRLLPGDHAFWFFRSPQEHREGVTTFVRTALDHGGKVLYLADTIAPATVAAYLRRAGLDPDALMVSGQLVLRSHRDAGSNRVFEPARHVQLFGELVEQARAERYRGLWATGEATWQLRDGIAAAGPSMELEQLLEQLFAGTGDGLLLCQYDASAIRSRPLETLRSTHNLELAAAGPRPLGRTIFELTVVPAECGMAVSGEVDMRTWAALANGLRRVADMAPDGRRVVLDLTRLSFIDGHGVGLIGTAARALGPSRPLLLRGAPPILLRIAEILGLDREPGLIIEGRTPMGTGSRAMQSGLEHPALLYSSPEDFLQTMVPFVSAGLNSRELVFVAARSDNLAALQAELGARAAAVQWADTERWHPHPGTRLRAVHELVTGALGAGATSVRLAGEPVWPAGPPELVREWQRYESALNAVLAPFPVTFVCLYDAASLDPSLVSVASRTHPAIYREGTRLASNRFEEPARFLRRWSPELAPPPPGAAHGPELADLAATRRFLVRRALDAGVQRSRALELCSAANEVLTNTMLHGNGATALSTWTDDGHFICQVEDRGDGITDPLAGYHPPAGPATRGRGLWLVRQLVDVLQIMPSFPGTTVRLHIRRA